MADIIKTQSTKLSFLELIARKDEIVIPIIQRDYAQGRSSLDATKIRQDFVEELHTKILNRQPLSLDFVYGTNSGNKFIPLDGQQRLTTLFLLHIYLEGVATSQLTEEHVPVDYKFSYETRDSSRRFCEEIIGHRFEIFDTDKLAQSKPSMIIQNQKWWFGVWYSDPTIAGMINMLDEIHKVFFADAVEAYSNLFTPEAQVVTFKFMPIENFYDPDDLYMKMNSRGLPLTPFEIFKSRFYCDIESKLDSNDVKLAKSDIDVKFTDFLWPLRSNGMENIDNYFQRIFKWIIAAEHVALSNASDVNWLDYLFEADGNTYPFAHNQFLKMNVTFSKELILRLWDDLKLLCSDCSPFHKLRTSFNNLSQWIDISSLWKDAFIEDKSRKPAYRQRLELHATLRFLATFPGINLANQIPVWFRLIHNLTDASNLDSSDRMASAIRNVESLIQSLKAYNNAVDVNDWLASSMNVKNNFFPLFQWEEEVVKAQLRKDPVWHEQLLRAEKNSYLKGEIALTLWLSDMLDGITCRTFNPSKANINRFKSCLDKVLPLMEEIGSADRDAVKKHSMVKAMLNKGDYMPEPSYGSNPVRKNTYNTPSNRDYSWKALFRICDKTHVEALNCLKEILNDTLYDVNDICGSLENIGSRKLHNSVPVWRRLLTSQFAHKVFDFSKRCFIAFSGDNVLIYGSSQRNGYHGELCSLYLFLLLQEQNVDVSYNWALGSDCDYGFTFIGKDGNAETITYWNNEWYYGDSASPDIFSLRKFLKSKL